MHLIIAAEIRPFDYVSTCLNTFGRQTFTCESSSEQAHAIIQMANSAFQYAFGISFEY